MILFVAMLMLCFVIFVFPVGKVITLVDAFLHAGVSLLPLLVLMVMASVEREELRG